MSTSNAPKDLLERWKRACAKLTVMQKEALVAYLQDAIVDESGLRPMAQLVEAGKWEEATALFERVRAEYPDLSELVHWELVIAWGEDDDASEGEEPL